MHASENEQIIDHGMELKISCLWILIHKFALFYPYFLFLSQ